MKLYEIDSAILEILQCTDDNGELTTEDIAKIDALQMERLAKFENICKLLRIWEAHKAGVQAELDRLNMAKRQDERNIKFLEDYVKASMVAEGRRPGPESKIEAGTFKLRLQTSGGLPAVTFPVDMKPEDLPERFQQHEIKPNLDAIRDAAAAGEELPAGVEVKRGFHLRIS